MITLSEERFALMVTAFSPFFCIYQLWLLHTLFDSSVGCDVVVVIKVLFWYMFLDRSL